MSQLARWTYKTAQLGTEFQKWEFHILSDLKWKWCILDENGCKLLFSLLMVDTAVCKQESMEINLQFEHLNCKGSCDFSCFKILCAFSIQIIVSINFRLMLKFLPFSVIVQLLPICFPLPNAKSFFSCFLKKCHKFSFIIIHYNFLANFLILFRQICSLYWFFQTFSNWPKCNLCFSWYSCRWWYLLSIWSNLALLI